MCGALPVVGATLMSDFGARRAGPHYGVDLRAPEGSSAYAVRDGVVRFVARNGELDRYGITVVIDHGPYLSLSAHLRSALVSRGARVGQGELIGTVGRTAGTLDVPDGVFARDPAHLHLEFLTAWPVRQGGAGRLDPARIFGELGIIVPEDGPIFSACDRGTRVASNVVRRGGQGLLFVAALWYAAKRLRSGV